MFIWYCTWYLTQNLKERTFYTFVTKLNYTIRFHFPASEGHRALPIAILEVDLYRSLVLDTFVTTACLPHYVPNNNATESSSTILDISDGGYKIHVAAGWGSIDSRYVVVEFC